MSPYVWNLGKSSSSGLSFWLSHLVTIRDFHNEIIRNWVLRHLSSASEVPFIHLHADCSVWMAGDTGHQELGAWQRHDDRHNSDDIMSQSQHRHRYHHRYHQPLSGSIYINTPSYNPYIAPHCHIIRGQGSVVHIIMNEDNNGYL